MVCLETTFVIDLLRGVKEAKEKLLFLEKSGENIFIASPTVVELISGAILTPRIENEKDKVIEFVSSLIVFPLDRDSAIIAGEIEADLSKKGEIIEVEDIMIGAIAKQNGERLITRNIKHFQRVKGLEIENY